MAARKPIDDPSKIGTAIIMGRRWRIEFCRMEHWGLCTGPDKPNKSIKLNRKLLRSGDDELLMDTVIHESLHAAGWHIDEIFVNQFASDVARLLSRMGYRRVTNEDLP